MRRSLLQFKNFRKTLKKNIKNRLALLSLALLYDTSLATAKPQENCNFLSVSYTHLTLATTS
ncbi:hypothetical protein FA419_15275, partial [Pseudomonas aeruginosa]|nr:hypothetical protein [Pseudomonas aeruginosa]